MPNPGLPICVPCGLTMRCQKNGVIVEEPQGWRWKADRYACPNCGRQIVVGFGAEPLPADYPEPTTHHFAYAMPQELAAIAAETQRTER